MINVLPIALLGGAAVMLMAGRRKKRPSKAGKVPSGAKDIGIPKPGKTAPAAPSSVEIAAINAAISAVLSPDWRPVYFLGQEGIDQGVIGIDADGFVHANNSESFSGWLTRVAYWGAYQTEGWPLELPPSCIMASTCPENLLDVRHAVLRINAGVKDTMAENNLGDVTIGKWKEFNKLA